MGLRLLNESIEVENKKWQGRKNVPNLINLFHVSFQSPIPERDRDLANLTLCDLPWAENHFQERIAGFPTNPGDTYFDWPYYIHKDREDKEYKAGDDKFTHTYQERFWPKLANKNEVAAAPHKGVRYLYGDYQSVIDLLLDQPFSRQAFLPIWFPEDTGAAHGGRVPCTLGYLFNLMPDNTMDITYYIRSCDYLRHFYNDIYLTGRLLQNTLKVLAKYQPPNWNHIKPGKLIMHITSLHAFHHETGLIKKRIKKYI